MKFAWENLQTPAKTVCQADDVSRGAAGCGGGGGANRISVYFSLSRFFFVTFVFEGGVGTKEWTRFSPPPLRNPPPRARASIDQARASELNVPQGFKSFFAAWAGEKTNSRAR